MFNLNSRIRLKKSPSELFKKLYLINENGDGHTYTRRTRAYEFIYDIKHRTVTVYSNKGLWGSITTENSYQCPMWIKNTIKELKDNDLIDEDFHASSIYHRMW